MSRNYILYVVGCAVGLPLLLMGFYFGGWSVIYLVRMFTKKRPWYFRLLFRLLHHRQKPRCNVGLGYPSPLMAFGFTIMVMCFPLYVSYEIGRMKLEQAWIGEMKEQQMHREKRLRKQPPAASTAPAVLLSSTASPAAPAGTVP